MKVSLLALQSEFSEWEFGWVGAVAWVAVVVWGAVQGLRIYAKLYREPKPQALHLFGLAHRQRRRRRNSGRAFQRAHSPAASEEPIAEPDNLLVGEPEPV